MCFTWLVKSYKWQIPCKPFWSNQWIWYHPQCHFPAPTTTSVQKIKIIRKKQHFFSQFFAKAFSPFSTGEASTPWLVFQQFIPFPLRMARQHDRFPVYFSFCRRRWWRSMMLDSYFIDFKRQKQTVCADERVSKETPFSFWWLVSSSSSSSSSS